MFFMSWPTKRRERLRYYIKQLNYAFEEFTLRLAKGREYNRIAEVRSFFFDEKDYTDIPKSSQLPSLQINFCLAQREKVYFFDHLSLS